MMLVSSRFREVWMVAIWLATSALCVIAQEPVLVYEFGKHTTEELMARLDNLHIQLNANEGTVALIRINRGVKDYVGFPSRYLARMKTYLINHKANEMRITVQECDGATDTQYQLFLVRKGTSVPVCPNTATVPQVTTLFDSYYYGYEYPGIDDCCNIPGADIRGASASLRSFGSLLQRSPGSLGYIIAYNGTNVWGYNNKTLRSLDPAKKATATVLSARSLLIKEGIDIKRLTVINGGYRDTLRNVELWFVPVGGKIPRATPNYFPKKRKLKTKH